MKWSVKFPAGMPSKAHKELKEKYSQVPPQLAIELYEEHKAKLLAEAEAKLKPATIALVEFPSTALARSTIGAINS